MTPILHIETEMARRYAKFQPVPGTDDQLSPTGMNRLYLEYDESGAFVELIPATGEVVEQGVMEPAEKVEPGREAA